MIAYRHPPPESLPRPHVGAKHARTFAIYIAHTPSLRRSPDEHAEIDRDDLCPLAVRHRRCIYCSQATGQPVPESHALDAFDQGLRGPGLSVAFAVKLRLTRRPADSREVSVDHQHALPAECRVVVRYSLAETVGRLAGR